MGIPSLGNPPARPVWFRASLSFSNGACVEVASLPGGQVGVRNSRDVCGPVLAFTPAEWHAFIGGVRSGEFDRFGQVTGNVSNGEQERGRGLTPSARGRTQVLAPARRPWGGHLPGRSSPAPAVIQPFAMVTELMTTLSFGTPPPAANEHVVPAWATLRRMARPEVMVPNGV